MSQLIVNLSAVCEPLHADRRRVPHGKFMDDSAEFFASKAPVKIRATARCATIFV